MTAPNDDNTASLETNHTNQKSEECCDNDLFFSPSPSCGVGATIAAIITLIVMLTAAKDMSTRDTAAAGLILFFGTAFIVSCCVYSIVFVLNAVGVCDDEALELHTQGKFFN